MIEQLRQNTRDIARIIRQLEAQARPEAVSSSISGTGTADRLAQFTAATVIGDANISDSVLNNVLDISANLTANRTLTLGDTDIALDQDLRTTDAPTFAGVTLNGNALITNGDELRFYDVGNSNYVGFEAPALTANQIWVLPNADGGANEFLQTDGAGNLTWAGGAGGTDLTGLGTNDRIARWNGTDTIQNSLVQIDDSGNIEFINDDLYIGRSGDVRIKFDSSNGYIDAILGDDAGSDRWRIIDSGAAEVAYIDSDGNAQFDGNVTAANHYVSDGGAFGISGAELITIDGANGFIELTGINALTLQDGDYIGIEASERLQFNAAGTIEVLGANLDLSGNDLLLDADADSYLHASADDTVQLIIGATHTFEFDSSGYLNIPNGGRVVTDAVYARDSDGLKLYEDGGSGIFVEDSTGNVGIGTTGPNDLLDVNGTLRITSDANNTKYITLDRNGPQALLQVHGNNSDFQINSSGSVDLHIKSDDGNVGIGTTGSNAKLHVDQSSATGAQPVIFADQGDISEQIIIASSDSNDRDITFVEFDVTGNPSWGWDESKTAFTQDADLILSHDDAEIQFPSDGGPHGLNFVNGECALYYRTSPNQLIVEDAAANSLLNIDVDTGDVCVNANTASGQLHVDQSSSTGAQPVLLLDQGDADQAFTNYVGSSGAGTSFSINTTERSTFQAMLQIEINGTTYWLKAYQ